MALDPLSAATRTEKRNLLALSVVAITFKAFNVKIEKIPFVGLSVDFEQGAFEFLLIIGIIYFGVTFTIYYFIDIRNDRKPDHLIAAEKRYRAKLDTYRAHASEVLARQMQEQLGPPYNVNSPTGHLDTALDAAEHDLPFKKKEEDVFFFVGVNRETPLGDIRKRGDDLVYAALPRYRRSFRRYRYLMGMWLSGVRFLYFVRNYGIDGLLPVVLGAVALLAIYDVISLSWLSWLLPPSALQAR